MQQTVKHQKLSNGEESYLQFGNLNVTKQTIYDALKKIME